PRGRPPRAWVKLPSARLLLRSSAPLRATMSRMPPACCSGVGAYVEVLLRDRIMSMNSPETDKLFAGSIPSLYDTHLVPLIFEPYAADLAQRLRKRTLSRVLEIAAGTGVVTRALADALPETVSIVATDLNQAMLDQAMRAGTRRAVQWRQADAMQLPFPDSSFDAVVCQFGVMFFPDKPRAFSEARRVLKPAGVFIFN